MHDVPDPDPSIGLHRGIRRFLGGCLVTLCVVLIAVYVIFWVMMSRSQAEARASLEWPTVPATVTAHEVLPLRGVHTEDARPTRSARGAFVARITYRYTVEGESFEGARLRVGARRFPDEESARAALAVFPVGEETVASVDPDDPTRAVLVPGPAEFDNTYFHAYGGGFLAIFVVLALVIRAIARAEPPRELLPDPPEDATAG